MMRFTIKHKYCSFVRVVKGYNVWDAFKKSGLDYRNWIVEEVEKIS